MRVVLYRLLLVITLIVSLQCIGPGGGAHAVRAIHWYGFMDNLYEPGSLDESMEIKPRAGLASGCCLSVVSTQ